MYVQRKSEGGLCNHCCRGKAVSIIYSKRASAASVTQHAKRMHHIVLSYMTCLYIYHIYIYIYIYIYTNTISQTADFLLKKLLIIKCVFWLSVQLLSETVHILQRIRRVIIKNLHRPSCKAHLILVRFQLTSIFFTDFQKINTNFHENPSNGSPVAPYRPTDGRTGGWTGRQTWRR